MASTPMMPLNADGSAPVAPPLPGTDMTSICFRDQLWLNTYPLDKNLVFDYFALSPFYDWTCNNEQLRARAIHPLDFSHISKMTGMEYTLSEVMEPNLFVIRKQKRDSPEKVTPMLTYYILDGSIYQAPQLCNVFAARLIGFDLVLTSDLSVGDPYQYCVKQGRALYHISKAFGTASSKLEKIGYVESENNSQASETKPAKEAIDFKELKRVDHILASLQRKLPAVPLPPPLPEGYAPPSTSEPSENQQPETQPPPIDPIIDQGPSKRMKYNYASVRTIQSLKNKEFNCL
uniref:Mediator of RNA polymerase II transcription subunit 6 n=1 Tax=Solanum lycopersicum TaxID=4081 RepID=A0A3Q7FX61_SOLLC